MGFRDLKAQCDVLKLDIDAAVAGVLASGSYVGDGPVSTFEREFAEYVGVRHCVTCANGTDALQLALIAWGIGPGDAVFVPDFTFFSSGEVVAAVGATPVFVDVREDTFNIDPWCPGEAVRHVEEKTDLTPKAVVAVDLFGLPADYPAIHPVCERHGLMLLEDGAQGFGGAIGEGAHARSATSPRRASSRRSPSAAMGTAARCSQTTNGRASSAATRCTARAR